MKTTVLLILSLIVLKGHTQSIDSIWFNNKWEKTSKEDGYYLRIQKNDSKSKIILIEDFYPTGEIQMKGTYLSMDPEIRNGEFIWFYKNGNKQKECYYYKNKIIECSEWTIDNVRKSDVIRVSNKFDGEEVYELKSIEKAPKFPGGIPKLIDFISKNTKYPEDAHQKGISGIVIVNFVVNKKGKVVKIKIANSIYPTLDNEALRVVKKMPKWMPGELNGRKVNVMYEIPINFKL